MERIGIFIDAANIYYGLHDSGTLGHRMNYQDLINWITGGNTPALTHYFCSAKNVSVLDRRQKFYAHLEHCGIKVWVTILRKLDGGHFKQEGVDIFLALKAVKYKDEYDKFILVSGDGDYTPLLQELISEGKTVEVISFKYAMNASYKEFTHRYMDDFIKQYRGTIYATH